MSEGRSLERFLKPPGSTAWPPPARHVLLGGLQATLTTVVGVLAASQFR